MGIVVALFIFYTGIQIVRDTVGSLLGQAPDPKLVKELESEILSFDGVVGVHDLIVHNYGPNRIFASAHAEVPSNEDIMKSHDTIDLIEREIKKKFHIDMVIHMDPIVVDDEQINRLRLQLSEIAREIDPRFTIHDFCMVEGPTHTNLIFDLVIPHNCKMKKSEIYRRVNELVNELGPQYYTVITVENSFVTETGLES